MSLPHFSHSIPDEKYLTDHCKADKPLVNSKPCGSNMQQSGKWDQSNKKKRVGGGLCAEKEVHTKTEEGQKWK